MMRCHKGAAAATSLQRLLACAAVSHQKAEPLRSIVRAVSCLSTQAHPAETGFASPRPDRAQRLLAATAAGLMAAAAASYGLSGDAAECKAEGQLPEYSAEEVAKHQTAADRIWVSYKDGVYDVTEFIESHPGGAAKLMLAAGGAIDPYWAMYQQHNVPEVHQILGQYRIGRLKGYNAEAAAKVSDPYTNEPTRLPALVIRSAKPFNAETPAAMLTEWLLTPNNLFYVRNHLPVPHIDRDKYKLQIEGEGLRSMQLSLPELQSRFKKHHVTATIQCAGNRRDELNQKVKEVRGLVWTQGAISTATWGGVWLRDVLLAAGLDPEEPGVAHIQFEGADADTEGQAYGASIPVKKAMDPHGDVLLAWEMNGEPIPLDHGAPLRVVVPGVTGARNVKWVTRIVASPQESASFWQRRDYKVFSPAVEWDSVTGKLWDATPAIQAMPVTSAICEPADGSTIGSWEDAVTVKGYAWSGGGNGIVRVDVSADGGKTWTVATLNKVPQPEGREWAWALWQAEVPLPKGHSGSLDLVAKATDSSYNTQPDSAASVWNLRGLNNNSWPRVTIGVVDE